MADVADRPRAQRTADLTADAELAETERLVEAVLDDLQRVGSAPDATEFRDLFVRARHVFTTAFGRDDAELREDLGVEAGTVESWLHGSPPPARERGEVLGHMRRTIEATWFVR